MRIPLSIFLKVIFFESTFDSAAVNKNSGAFGYMQLMPRTFKSIYNKLELVGGKTTVNNLICGGYLLKQNFDYWYKRNKTKKESWELALACYVMGDSLPKALGRMPRSKEVTTYVNNILKNENF
jgi:soluble lytic murein transglycosylase-like protein